MSARLRAHTCSPALDLAAPASPIRSAVTASAKVIVAAAPAPPTAAPKKANFKSLAFIGTVLGVALGMLAVCWFSLHSPMPKSPDYGRLLIDPGHTPVKDGGTNPPAGYFKAELAPLPKPTHIITVPFDNPIRREWTNDNAAESSSVGGQRIIITVTGNNNVFNAPLVVNGMTNQATNQASPAVKPVRPPRPPKPAKVAPQPTPTVIVTNTVTVTVTNTVDNSVPPPPPVIVEPYGYNGFRWHARVLVRPLSPPVEVAPYGYPPIQY